MLAPIDQTAAEFAAAPMVFDQPRDLQEDVLVGSLRGVLRLAVEREGQWDETARLAESFLDWLQYRLKRLD